MASFPKLGRVMGAGVLAGLLLAAPGYAQTDEARAGARSAAEEGAAAWDERRWSDAADLFSRAESLVHSPVHLLYLARSYEKLGAFVRAREAYQKVVNEELPPNSPEPWKQAKTDAQTELDALKPKIPYVTVVVEGAGTNPVTVTMDGVVIPAALVGVPRPVDPGEHKFEAVAQGLSSGPTAVMAQAGRREKVVLTLGSSGVAASGVVPAATPAGTSAATEGPPGATDSPMADSGRGGGIPRWSTWVAFGVGAVGLGVGTVFAFSAKSSRNELGDLVKRVCTLGPSDHSSFTEDGSCPESRKSEIEGLKSDGDSAATIATVGFVAGGVGVATGVVLFFLTNKRSEPAPTAYVRPFVGVRSAGVVGTF